MKNSDLWIVPEWPAPKTVRALTTLRAADSGYSRGPYAGFNMASHVGDDEHSVLKNRILLKEQAELPEDPAWLMQVHGIEVIHVEDVSPHKPPPEVDAAISNTPFKIAAVLTADCLPVLLCNAEGTEVAAIHAGWRGLASGVIEATVAKLKSPPEQLFAWLGPAIGPKVYVVGIETFDAFSKPGDDTAFTKVAEAQWLTDLYCLARLRLKALNITQIFGGDYCTFSEPDRFYSFRRSSPTGRMATLIWFNHN